MKKIPKKREPIVEKVIKTVDLMWPIKGSNKGLMRQSTLNYWKFGATLPNMLANQGIDIILKKGKNVYSMFYGKVVNVFVDDDGIGYVDVKVPRDVYNHCSLRSRNMIVRYSNIKVNKDISNDDVVDISTVIGEAQDNEWIPGAISLHLELHVANIRFNPEPILVKSQPRS